MSQTVLILETVSERCRLWYLWPAFAWALTSSGSTFPSLSLKTYKSVLPNHISTILARLSSSQQNWIRCHTSSFMQVSMCVLYAPGMSVPFPLDFGTRAGLNGSIPSGPAHSGSACALSDLSWTASVAIDKCSVFFWRFEAPFFVCLELDLAAAAVPYFGLGQFPWWVFTLFVWKRNDFSFLVFAGFFAIRWRFAFFGRSLFWGLHAFNLHLLFWWFFCAECQVNAIATVGIQTIVHSVSHISFHSPSSSSSSLELSSWFDPFSHS